MSPPKRTKNNLEILIAEDSPTQAAQLKSLLEENGYTVQAAANGKEALAAALKRKPSLVISDIVMPEMNGYVLCKELKSRKKLKDVPVVLLTQLSTPDDVIKGLQSGADNFIRKPYDQKYLLSRVEYILTNRKLRGTEKVHLGLEIYLSGQRHFITSERQQILDLLVSTYEEAVQLNDQLAEREKRLAHSNQVLNGLYRIADGLNQAISGQEVAEKSIKRAMELPGVQAAWMSLREGEYDFRVAAATGLPPALEMPGAFSGDCLCRRKLLSGELDQVTNILECERLSNATGDTRGLRYHASVPLWVGDRTLGIMNLAGPDEGLFTNEELKFLHSVGNQVATALERAHLHENLEKMVHERTAALRVEVAERKRAQEEVQRNLDRIRALHEIDTAITSTLELETVLRILLEKIDLFLPCPAATTVLLLNRETGELERVVSRNLDEKEWKSRQHIKPGLSIQVAVTKIPLTVRNIQTGPQLADPSYLRKHGLVSYLGIPMVAKDQTVGVLSFYTKEEHDFTQEEIDFLSTLAGQAAIAIHNAQLYEGMTKLADDLSRSNRVKDEFLSVMSHELRTPLNVVMGYTAMVRDGLLGEINPKQEDALAKVMIQSNEQLAMVNNILYATVLEAQKIKVESQALVLGDLFNQLKSAYEVSLNKPLEFIWDCSSPLAVVNVDAAKIKQVLQNLIHNAIKFTEKGNVRISARVLESDTGVRDQGSGVSAEPRPPTPGPRFVEFKVADTGIGIPKDYLTFVFERFQQVDSSETRLYGGVGVGLYIVRKFTEILGGKVSVESEVGKGSTFTVKIPLKN